MIFCIVYKSEFKNPTDWIGLLVKWLFDTSILSNKKESSWKWTLLFDSVFEYSALVTSSFDSIGKEY